MEFKVLPLEKAKIRIAVDLLASEVAVLFDRNYKSLSYKVKIKGFRPGKVPVSIIKSRFYDVAKSDSFEMAVNESLSKIFKDNAISSFSRPVIDDFDACFEKFNEASDFSFSVVLEKMPAITKMPNYKGINLELDSYFYDKTHVDFQLSQLRYKMARIVPKKNSLVGEKDFLEIQYNFYLINFDESNNKLLSFSMEDSNTLFEEIKLKFIGMKIGQSAHFPCIIPEKFEDRSMKGKKGYLYIKIIAINDYLLPELDNEFAKDCNYQSLDDLRKSLEKALQDACFARKEDSIFNVCVEKLIKQCSFEIGEGFIFDRVSARVNEFKTKLEKQDITFEKYLKENKKNNESFHSEVQKNVDKEVKYHLICSKIIDNENITVNDSDIEVVIDNYARENNIDSSLLKKNTNYNFFKDIALSNNLRKWFADNSIVKIKKQIPLFDIDVKS